MLLRLPIVGSLFSDKRSWSQKAKKYKYLKSRFYYNGFIYESLKWE